jgi:hypothetical protein
MNTNLTSIIAVSVSNNYNNNPFSSAMDLSLDARRRRHRGGGVRGTRNEEIPLALTPTVSPSVFSSEFSSHSLKVLGFCLHFSYFCVLFLG